MSVYMAVSRDDMTGNDAQKARMWPLLRAT